MMNEETLASIFQRSLGAPVEIHGKIVQPIVLLDNLQPLQKILFKWISVKDAPTQGLRFKAVNGYLEVNGYSNHEIILWADTSPNTVEMLVKFKGEGILKVWNVWKIGEGTEAWIGNACINIRKENQLIFLSCSDGVGEVRLDDLKVCIEILD